MTLSASDQLEILALVTRADACATSRDATGYTALFTDDGAMRGTMGDAQGRDALRDTVSAVWAREPAGTLHLTLNSIIDPAGEEPSVDSVMLLVVPGAGPSVIGAARVRQRVRRTPQGWRISERAIETNAG